jgi:hypothetical protein
MTFPNLRRTIGVVALAGHLFLTAASSGAEENFSSVFISEIAANNQHGLRDEEQDRSNWIELHNGGRAVKSLRGWHLTDTPDNLTKWRIPSVSLLPDKSIVIFASGKDRTNDLAHLHTNFRLNPRGGYLALVDRSTNVVSEFAPGYPGQMPDTSYVSLRDEPGIRGNINHPTPGKPNSFQGEEFAPGVAFSRPGGTFLEPFALALSTASTGAVIRYTIDGTLPSSRSPAYHAPFLVTNSTYLRARAYQENLLPGPPHSEAYLELSTNATEFSSTLPVLIMNTFGRNEPVSANESFVHLSLLEPVDGRTSLTNPSTLTTRAGHRIRGSTSAGMPQAGFAIEFIDEFNHERNLSLLGLPADSDWVLYAPNAYDPVLIHNPFIHQLSRDLGRYSPRTQFVEVFLIRSTGRVREAHYHGMCVLEEKIKIGRHRVNISRLGSDDVHPPEVTGGYLLKFDRLGPGESGVFSIGERGMVHVDPKEQVMRLPQRAAQRDYLVNYLAEFDRALNGSDWKDSATGYRAFLDVDGAIDFHVLEVLSGNVDALVLSTYFHKPRNGRITFGPHWDFDRALGSTDGRDENPRMWNTGGFFGGEWWPRLFRDPDFWQQWVDRWQQLRGNHFALTNLNRLIDELAAELRDAQPRQYQRWHFQPRGGSYQSEIQLMKRWLSNRLDFIDGQLTQPPRASHENGPLTLLDLFASTNATIYYTLDGTDPRMPQGAVASNALAYATPVRLDAGQRLVARAHNSRQRQTDGPPLSTPWSGPIVVGPAARQP